MSTATAAQHNQPRNLVVGIVAVSLAHWAMQAWQWSAPLQSPQPVVLQQQEVVAQAQWTSVLLPPASGSTPAPASTLSQWHVLGIVSTQAELGIAMLRSPAGEELLVRTGQSFAPGLVLKYVTDTAVHITLPNGQTQQIQSQAVPKSTAQSEKNRH